MTTMESPFSGSLVAFNGMMVRLASEYICEYRSAEWKKGNEKKNGKK